MPNKKILIIDDDDQDRKIITRFLKKAGYENIVLAATGGEGIKMVEAEKPFLIILDTVLPDIIGFEVCEKIREIEGAGTSKIIMQTGSINAVDALRAKEAGVDEYCVKTIDCSQLDEAMKRIM